MIEAVTFDFWETLAKDSPENLRRTGALRIDGIRDALRRGGLDPPREGLAAAHEKSMVRIAAIWRTGGDVGTRGQVAILLDCLDPSLPGALNADTWASLEEAYATPALRFPPTVRDGAAQALRALRDRGVRIGLISNTGRTPGRVLRMILDRAGLLEHFQALTFSDEAGIRKPDPRVFRWTLQGLSSRPERAAHVGDDLAADVGGAQAAGLRGIHLADGMPSPAPDPSGGTAPVAPAATIRALAELLPALEPFGLPSIA